MKDRLDLQDALRSSEWSVEKAIEKLRSDTIPVKKNPEKKVVALSEKKSNIFSIFLKLP